MAVELRVPPVGESITEVAIGEWLKSEGEFVAEDEVVVIVESDKVNMEVPAPVSGYLEKIVKASGSTASVGDVIGVIAEAAAPAGDGVAAAAKDPAFDTPDTVVPPTPAKADGPARVTPAARRALAAHGLAADEVQGSGPAGRLLKDDVLRHAEARPAPPETATPAAPRGSRGEERVRMSPLRKTVAKRLVLAQQSAALLTTFNEVDMSAVMALRREHQPDFTARYDVKLGFMSFFVKAVVDALGQFPALNGRVDGDDIVYHDYCDIGVAIGGGRGLVVPVLRNAESLSFSQIEQAINDLGRRAKANKLKLDELVGGTFSITNGGVYGSLLSTPIINPPQSGILGMHGIQDRPIAVDGEVVIRPMMYLALTYDHRLVDGREAVSFLRRVKACVEAPVRMLLEV